MAWRVCILERISAGHTGDLHTSQLQTQSHRRSTAVNSKMPTGVQVLDEDHYGWGQ